MAHDATQTSEGTRTPAPDDDIADGLTCPACAAASMWYLIDPRDRYDGCTCDTCGHTVGLLDYLLGVGLSTRDVVGLALATGTRVQSADA